MKYNIKYTSEYILKLQIHQHIEGLPLSEGKDKLFVVVDCLTNYAHFMGIKKTDSAKQIAEVFCKNIYK